jgi:hypothetical protein
MAAEDARIAKAWANRRSDPSVWNRVLSKVRSEIISEMSKKPDADLTHTSESLASAVHSANTSNAPDSDDMPDLKSMSNTEFENFKSKLK